MNDSARMVLVFGLDMEGLFEQRMTPFFGGYSEVVLFHYGR